MSHGANLAQGSVLMPDHAYALTRIESAKGAAAVQIEGRLTFAEAGSLWTDLNKTVESVDKGDQIDLDMSKVELVDGGSMALLVQLRADLHRRGAKSEFVGAEEQVQEIIHLYRGDVGVGRFKKRRAQNLVEQIGQSTMSILDEFKQVFGFFGQALVATVGVIAKPGTANWKDVMPTMERTGADAVPIVILINFLIGFVMAFQGAVQLKQFGANIFVADLVGLSICRELGPLMTAIILCGRSGAAFAAEIGSMKVSEEIDALRTMGFGPMRFLVLPRTIALMLVMPLLTLLGDAVGILGGLVVGIISLDLTVVAYLNETQKALDVWDIFSGCIKSVVFAMVISLISCQQGLATSGGAEGVGKRTTSSVVSILFALILVDAGFTILFHAFDL
jgi:phospholipid/cholesterol/gamma-HCH transport system permease protein